MLRISRAGRYLVGMKRAAWFIVSELLLVLTIVLVFSNWNGTSGFSLSWPASSSTVSITGGEQGSRVLLAFISAILTVLTFVLGIIRLFQRDKKNVPPAAPKPAPPPASTAPGSQAH